MADVAISVSYTHLDVYKRQEVQLTSLINKQNNQAIEVVIDTNEHIILEELWYKIEDTYFTRTEIVLHTKVIRTTSAEEMMDHG